MFRDLMDRLLSRWYVPRYLYDGHVAATERAMQNLEKQIDLWAALAKEGDEANRNSQVEAALVELENARANGLKNH